MPGTVSPAAQRPRIARLVCVVAGALVLALHAPASTARERLALRHVPIELPGAPSAVVATDLDADGCQDLLVVVAYTHWGQIGIEESTEMDDIEGLVEVMTIVPSLVDRRELWAFACRSGGGFEVTGPPLELDRTVLSLERGPEGIPAIALTDDGVSRVTLDSEGRPAFTPIITSPPVLAHSGSFVSRLRLLHDLDGDGVRDLILPTAEALEIYPAENGGLRSEPIDRLVYPEDPRAHRRLVRDIPLPEVRDVDGDGHVDLLLRRPGDGWRRFDVLRGVGDGRFRPALRPVGSADDRDALRHWDDGVASLAFFGDLDGDGRAEYVTAQGMADEDAGFRKEMAQAKNPPMRYQLHRSGDELAMDDAPFQTFEATGYAFDTGEDDESGIRLPGGFQDLDGDGRQDLITLTLDFSLWQAVRILTVKSLSIGLDFHVWCQREDGQFRAVPNLDLSGRFRINLNDLRLGHLSQFAGDFDGDGRADFVQMGRGKKVTIHRGGDGCGYPSAPDLTIALAEAPRNLALVRIDDLDGDDRSDLTIVQPQKAKNAGETPPVRLDLYLSGDAR